MPRTTTKGIVIVETVGIIKGEPFQDMSNLSPLTGVIEENEVIIDFGQYEGQSVEDLKTVDPDLYQQLVRAKESDNIAIRRNKDKSYRLYMNPLLSKAASV